MNVRREVHYSGQVQGVGFRHTVRMIARGYAVTGFVRNLPDGRVQLVAEGEPAEVADLVREIAARMRANVRRATVDEQPPTGEFTAFEIRY